MQLRATVFKNASIFSLSTTWHICSTASCHVRQPVYFFLILVAGRAARLMPIATLLEPYIEVTLWPHLYCLQNRCESARYACDDWKPFQKQKKRTGCRDSAKAMFIDNVLSGIANFATDRSLLQFQFERHILRSVVTARCEVHTI